MSLHVSQPRDDHGDAWSEKVDKGRGKPIADGKYRVDDAHGDETIGCVIGIMVFYALYDSTLLLTRKYIITIQLQSKIIFSLTCIMPPV